MASNDTALYNQIDGAAPKYLERGWVGGVYATYREGGGSLNVAIHNMGSPVGAEAMFNYDLPTSRLEIAYTKDASGNSIPQAIVNLGLMDSYAAAAFVDQYYIEVSIADRSDAALIYVKTFTMQILNSRG